MSLKVMFLFMRLLLAIYAVLPAVVESELATSTSVLPFQPKPGCLTNCGDVNISFPFGIGEDCHLSSYFNVTCNTSSNPPQLYLGDETSGIKIKGINMDGTLHTFGLTARVCFDENGNKNKTKSSDWSWMRLGGYRLYGSKNKLLVIGCDSYADLLGYYLGENNNELRTGCFVECSSLDYVSNSTCRGQGCCQVDIPDGIRSFNVTAKSFNNHTSVWRFNPCTYAFLVEEDTIHFNTSLLDMKDENEQFSLVLEWALNGTNAREDLLLRTMCNDDHNSTITEPDNRDNDRCRCVCKPGFEGNPYLVPPHGCKDIDECAEGRHDCLDIQHCANTNGSYKCICPKGQQGDGKVEGKGKGCQRSLNIPLIMGSFCGGTVMLYIIVTLVYYRIQKRRINKRKENNFERNGGQVLQSLMSQASEANKKVLRIFTEDELRKGTNNFDKDKIVGRGGFGTVYKGKIDGEVVAIKMAKEIDSRQTKQFINEMIILSQISHPNVVKLVGCCLETEVPLLVYEFIENKTLEHHIVNELLAWNARLRIAAESARAVAHMHEDSRHIIHRDIKSANILLDNNFTAKVSDFGASKLIASDQIHLSTLVTGTHGYIDPEYIVTGLLDKTIDIYSYGVVLVELLMGKTVGTFSISTENKNDFVTYFIKAMIEDHLFDVLDATLREEKEIKVQVKGVAEVARRCSSKKGSKRPTMNQVETWLEKLEKDKFFHIEEVDDDDDEDEMEVTQ